MASQNFHEVGLFRQVIYQEKTQSSQPDNEAFSGPVLVLLGQTFYVL